MFLQLVEQPRGGTLEQEAVSTMRASGFKVRDGVSRQINGLEAFVGTFQGEIRGVGAAVSRTAYIASGRSVFRLSGLAPSAHFDEWAAAFDAAIASFRALAPAEARDVRPNRIDFYTVREGDTWQALAARQSGSNVKPTMLAIINGSPVNEQPRPGDRIKIVVSAGPEHGDDGDSVDRPRPAVHPEPSLR
jgi:predicted Zn-dependent protease